MKLIVFLLSLFYFLSFSKPEKGVTLTFKNDMDRDFQTLKVNIRGQLYVFYNLKAGKKQKL